MKNLAHSKHLKNGFYLITSATVVVDVMIGQKTEFSAVTEMPSKRHFQTSSPMPQSHCTDRETEIPANPATLETSELELEGWVPEVHSA